MSDLSIVEKRVLERVLQMSGGYVLDFSDRTFQEFVADSVSLDIYDPKYVHASGSKANMLRGFWKVAPNAVVGKLLKDLLDRAVTNRDIKLEDPDLQASYRAAARLKQDRPVPELDALTNLDEKDFEVVAKAVKDAIDRNEPETGLDRLHTFLMKYLRSRLQDAGVTAKRDTPLHSLFGQYVKTLEQSGHIESEMTLRILKTSISNLEAFNDVRNNRSLAHDNLILNYEEALLIFNHVASSVRFLRSVEARKGMSRTKLGSVK